MRFAYIGSVVAVIPGAVHALGSADDAGESRRGMVCRMEQVGLLVEAASAQATLAELGVVLDKWGMAARSALEKPEQLEIRQAALAGINFCHRRRGWLLRCADLALERLPVEARAHHWCHGGEEGGLGFFASAAADLAPWDDCELVLKPAGG